VFLTYLWALLRQPGAYCCRTPGRRIIAGLLAIGNRLPIASDERV